MALEDRDIFQAICDRFSDQPLEFIMAQYEKAKRLNMQIEMRLAGDHLDKKQDVKQDEVDCVAFSSNEPDEEASPAPKKKYTKRMLKVKPQEAITDESIACCICGEKRKLLTKTHLASHGIAVEEYKALCGYDQKQPLMSNNRAEESKKIIAKAQAARMAKKAAK